MHISQEEMAKALIPLAWRDYCAHLVPELNKCRVGTYYVPWACDKERIAWEKCQYDDYQRRMKILTKQKRAEELGASQKLSSELDS
ncbi:NADH-ubiquinone oxidoreductase B18 subunit-domain-containing protein [Cladochytrium replicatum]|nr:NADH-ubiquinone oxidoreductase B18 subunit-domain-containing protein [Cladochytrium replicatum]